MLYDSVSDAMTLKISPAALPKVAGVSNSGRDVLSPSVVAPGRGGPAKRPRALLLHDRAPGLPSDLLLRKIEQPATTARGHGAEADTAAADIAAADTAIADTATADASPWRSLLKPTAVR